MPAGQMGGAPLPVQSSMPHMSNPFSQQPGLPTMQGGPPPMYGGVGPPPPNAAQGIVPVYSHGAASSLQKTNSVNRTFQPGVLK